MRAHLHDESLFAFETRNPRWADLQTGDEEYEGLFVNLETRDEEKYWRTYIDGGGRDVRVSKTQAYDHVAQVLHWTTYRRWLEGDREQTKITRIAVRYTFRRSSRRCCTTTASLSNGGTAIGISSR